MNRRMSESLIYSPKEVAAFDGLFRLTADGKPFSNIKVQDIATAAGIGKGTLYEYFSSKEEILAGAVLYALNRAVDWLEHQLNEEISLYHTLETFLDLLENEQILPVTALNILLSRVSVQQKQELKQQYQDKMQEIFHRIKQCETQFFEAGRRNGEIDPALDDCFCEYVIVSALFGVAGKQMCAHQQGEKTEWKMVQQMVVRALRPSIDNHNCMKLEKINLCTKINKKYPQDVGGNTSDER